MDKTTAKATEGGWGKPANSRKWHYFRDSRSLCGRWAYSGDLDSEDVVSPDNCAACYRKRVAQTSGRQGQSRG